MNERAQNRALVEQAFAAFQSGDVAGVNALLDPAIEIVISDQLANPGTWSGVDGFWEAVSIWLEAWDEFKIDLRSIDTPDDHHVIAETLQTATGRASGVPVELSTYFLFEVRGGRTARYELHPSREAAIAAMTPQ
jgi:ketosteroid isomerase-like protein